MKYDRILLKLSGESLQGIQKYGLSTDVLHSYAEQIKAVVRTGVQVGIVIGGGNIFRGLQGARKGFDRVKGDQMGMLATIINSLALQSALEDNGVKAKVLTSIRMEPIGEYYSKAKALEYLEAGYVVIIGGGTSNPYFSTDSASALRGIELEADVMLKGTRVDGVYTADPEKDPAAEKFDEITFDEVYRRNLKVMDMTAFTLCRENGLRVIVFDMDSGQPGKGARRREDRHTGQTLKTYYIAMTERKKPNNKRLILMIVLLAVVIALMWLLPDGSQPAAPATNAPKTEQTKNTNDAPDDIEATTLVKAGTQAPDFRVEMFDGTTFTLGSLRGKVVLLNFWATWCGPCREELSRVQKDIIDRFKGNEDFVFLPVSRGETRETVAAFREKLGYTFPMGLDPEQKIYRLYASNYIPRNFLIGKDGKVISATIGYEAPEFDELILLIERQLNSAN